MEKQKLTPFLVRLRPTTKALLDTAAVDREQSRASLVDEAVRAYLTPKVPMGIESRLKGMLDRQGGA